MDYSSAHVLEYRSYLLSVLVVITLKDVFGRTFFVSGGNKERKNSSLDVVDFSISHHFKILNHTSHI